MIKISENEFKLFSKYILEICGIALDTGKEYLIETRLNSVLDENKCKSYNELYTKAKVDRTKSIEKKIIDAISTNETYFFRDNLPFNLLQYKILPDLIDARTKQNKGRYPFPIRIWSAACSTGQEIYSIAMTIKDMRIDPKKYDIRLLGTDISDAAIAQSSYAKYNKFEVARGLTQEKLSQYFIRDGDSWRIKDELRAMAVFKKINLMQPVAGVGKFDIIFCRNVMIYFTTHDRRKLYQKLASILEPDGYLLIGSTESLINDTDLFEPKRYLKTVFYQIKNK
ncbi:MAG: protein-glutamate O-methyltransferase CheR [Desulfobacterales bacterium]|nr:protein-glutamate O-methyltransferase CheR [Desulfobacterales bacterium]